MKRTIILLFDSFGIGASQDAAKYGDVGADTFGHIAEFCAEGKADKPGVRQGALQLPNFTRLGLGLASLASTGRMPPGLDRHATVTGAFGYAVEQSKGKDTPSGHWELAGVPVLFDWGYFSAQQPSFPKELVDQFIARAKLPGILGNRHASGTQILEELGAEHVATGKPIVYTSSDSVFQIAANEETFGLQRLYEICDIARELVNAYNIGRVIARPFIGTAGNFKRTYNRRDISLPAPQPTLLDYLIEQGGTVTAIGKVADIYAHRGITHTIKADGNMSLFDATLKAAQQPNDKNLIFTNFVDFDMLYGHRRDVVGYAAALEALDARLPELEKILQPGDLVIITADHGCDPTMPGSDHTREHVPILLFGPSIESKFLGRRESMADIGQSVATHLGIEALPYGISFI